MAKYLKRYNARLALQKLRESKAWVAKKYMLLETDEGDLEIQKGDEVVLCPYDPETNKYLTQSPYCEIIRTIGDVYPVNDETVVFSLLKYTRPKG